MDLLLPDIDKILGLYNAKVVMQVCGNFALKEEFGELTQELNDKRAAEHHKLTEEAHQAIKSEIIRMLEALRAELPSPAKPKTDYDKGWNDGLAIPITAIDDLIKALNLDEEKL